MSFEDKKEYTPRSSLKQMPGQKPSMFDNKPKPPTQQQFEQNVQEVQKKAMAHQKKATELFLAFKKMIDDKTLAQNRNMLMMDAEREVLQNMIRLAQSVNLDPNEAEGEGTLMWIVCLLKTCLTQRDRINELEFVINSLQKNVGSFEDTIKREIKLALDNFKPGV
jgi:hypothetical protein